jgi:succinate dehydrogenase / fumarate reductase flavoprotein subunit
VNTVDYLITVLLRDFETFFYAKGQTGQQLLLGAYSAMNRQIGRGKIKSYTSRNARFGSDLVKRGIIARDLVTGEIERHSAHAVVIASGGYGNVFFLSTYAMVVNCCLENP